MVVFAVRRQEKYGDENGDGFRYGNGKPDAVDAEEPWQNQDTSGDENKGTQERDHCRHLPIGQCRKEGGGKDVDACEKEVPDEDFIPIERDRIGVAFLRRKDGDGRHCHQIGKAEAHHRGDQNDAEAHFEETFQLWNIAVAVIVAEDRGRTAGKAQICRRKQELGIQHNGNGCNAIFLQQFHHCQIEQKGGHSHGSGGHHFRRAIQHGVGNDFSVPFGFYKIQHCPWLSKIEQCRDAANDKAADSTPGCPGDAHIHSDDEDIVEKDIGETCCDIQP